MHNYISYKAASLYEPIIGTLLQGLRKEMCELVGMHKTKVLLDCCCGAGGFLHMLQKHNIQHSWEQGIYMGLDKSQAMLQAQKGISKVHRIHGDAMVLPFATQSLDMATLCMALHTFSPEQGQQVLQELLRVARCVVVADYTLVERNIYFPSAWLAHGVEFLVGGEHYACYKQFMQGGALEGFCYSQGLHIQERRMTLGGAGLIALIHSQYKAS